jgi:hypothetical protein
LFHPKCRFGYPQLSLDDKPIAPDKALSAIMRYHKLSADQVAKLCSVSLSTVYKWRTGAREIPAQVWLVFNLYQIEFEKALEHLILTGYTPTQKFGGIFKASEMAYENLIVYWYSKA